jgi:hypothetical protein
MRNSPNRPKDFTFAGNINNIDQRGKCILEAVLVNAFPEMKKNFVKAYEMLLPGFLDL